MSKHETADRRRQQEIAFNMVMDDLDRMMDEVSGLTQFMQNSDPFTLVIAPEIDKKCVWREAAGNIQSASAALRLAKSGLELIKWPQRSE